MFSREIGRPSALSQLWSPMANPQPKPEQRRQLPHCYHEGYLEKMSAKEKVSQRLWASLCGNSLFFYNTSKDTEYVDRIDLDGFISLLDDSSRDRNLEAARLKLRTKEGEFKITVPTLENRELWKGFIHAVAELSVPSSLNLLTGQVHMLQGVVEMERERQRTAPAPDMSRNLYLSLLADMPQCFHEVSRKEAMDLLEKYTDCGNMLLRPSKDGSMAVTTRQDLNGSVFHHYRVSRRPEGGFVINLETPLPCATLQEVIRCLKKRSSGALQPFILENIYNDNITLVQQNNENGEKNLKFVTGSPSLKTPLPGSDKKQECHGVSFGACAPACNSKTVRKLVSPDQNSLPSDTNREDHPSGIDQHLVTVPSMTPSTSIHNKQATPKPPVATGSSTGNLPLVKAKAPESTHIGCSTRPPMPLPKTVRKFVSPDQNREKQVIPKPPLAMGISTGNSSLIDDLDISAECWDPISCLVMNLKEVTSDSHLNPPQASTITMCTGKLNDHLSEELKKKLEARRGNLK